MTIEEIKNNIEEWLRSKGWVQEEPDTWKKQLQMTIGEMIVNGQRQTQTQTMDMSLKYDGPGWVGDDSNREEFTLWTIILQDQSITFNAVSPEEFLEFIPLQKL